MAQLAVDLEIFDEIPRKMLSRKKRMKHTPFHKSLKKASASKMVALVQKDSDENIADDDRTFVTSEEDNKKDLITDSAWRTTLGIISAISVLSCCVIS